MTATQILLERTRASLDRWRAERAAKRMLQELHDASELPCKKCGAKPAGYVSRLCALCFPKVVG